MMIAICGSKTGIQPPLTTSRCVLSWRLSYTLGADLCVDVSEEALSSDVPGIFNSDQGSQFTSDAFTSVLLIRGVQISMDSAGSYLVRLRRSVKYEEVCLKAYESVPQARVGICAYLSFYDDERPYRVFIVWNSGMAEHTCVDREVRERQHCSSGRSQQRYARQKTSPVDFVGLCSSLHLGRSTGLDSVDAALQTNSGGVP